jgi:hypothetical protein
VTDYETCDVCHEHLCPECGGHADDCPVLLSQIAERDAQDEIDRRSNPAQRLYDERSYLGVMLHQRAAVVARELGVRFRDHGGAHGQAQLSMLRYNPSVMAADRSPVAAVLDDDELLDYQPPSAARTLTHTFANFPRPRDVHAAHAEMLEKLTRGGYTLTEAEAQKLALSLRDGQ